METVYVDEKTEKSNNRKRLLLQIVVCTTISFTIVSYIQYKTATASITIEIPDYLINRKSGVGDSKGQIKSETENKASPKPLNDAVKLKTIVKDGANGDEGEQTVSNVPKLKIVDTLRSRDQLDSGLDEISKSSGTQPESIVKDKNIGVSGARVIPKFGNSDNSKDNSKTLLDLLNDRLVNFKPKNVTEIPITKPQQSKKVIILFWSLVYNKTRTYDFKICKFKNCVATFNRSLLAESSAVVFHMWDLARHKKRDIPNRRWPNQRWVLYGHESAANVDFPLYYDVKFNLTFTYKDDADLFFGYGCFSKRPVPLLAKNAELSNIGKKTRLVAWVISHCNASSLRDQYIAELSKYIPVDGYGRCANNSRCTEVGDGWHDQTSRQSCELVIRDNYKFYLAFENSICNGYATEKVWNKLKFGTVPIVMGGSNYTKILPPNSFIDVRNFSSPQALAKYIQKVDSDDSLYNSYFAWQRNYQIKCEPFKCNLCNYLNTHKEKKVLQNVEKWWKDCTNPKDYYRGVADMII